MTTQTLQKWLKNRPDSFHEWLNGRRVDEVECVVSDIAGVARGKTMPARKFARQERLFLPTSIFYQTITGSYAEMEDVENQWTEADMLLTPDLETVTAAPWTGDVSLQVIHDITNLDGEPVGLAPRNVLKRVLSFYEKNNWKAVVAPELEFYLTKPNINPDNPIEPQIGRTGRKVVGRQSYSMSAVDEYGPVIDDIYDFAEAQGFEIDTIIQEGGAGQIEINLQHGDPVALADQVFYYKRSIREAALRHNCFATFMAKPMQDEPGSAMHIHQSIIDSKTGNNIFSTKQGQATDLFYGFIAGQQKFLPQVFCMLAPYVNSYRRFVPGDSAPINLEWGKDNRTTGLRIPISSAQARRVENRIVGMDCNPYLALAASLAAGFLGMTQKLKPRDALKGEAEESEITLPRSLMGAMDMFDGENGMTDMLGEDFCRLYGAIKRSESDEFLQVISPWERDHLLLNV
jgi:glutamine synthetase